MAYHILVADDASMNRILIKDILAKSLENVTFEEAINGVEVLEIVDKTEIDLIILDLVMPVMNGYETLKRLKRHPQHHDIPVIVNSAITEIDSIEQTLKDGAVDYFAKPLSRNDMQIILPLKAKNALMLHEQQMTITLLNKQINEELKNANTFANIMLPREGSLQTVDFYCKYHPSLGIGGDFFDCVEKDGRVYFMIADVTGHGIAAGMASSMVKILYRKIIEQPGIMPHEVLTEMNRSIFSTFDFAGRDNYFVFTAFVGIIEGETLYYSNAAHPYPLIYRADLCQFIGIDQAGFLVGMFESATFETEETKLSHEDMIFIYTDGLFCAGAGNDFTGWEKVKALSNRLSPLIQSSPKDFLDDLFYGFHMIHKSMQLDFTDDVAMMLLKIKP